MKQFMLVHVGFESPTPEIMQAWRRWFEVNAERTLENVGLRNGREITEAGAHALAMGGETLTGYTIINARDFDEAEEVARSVPFISGVRVYEIVRH